MEEERIAVHPAAATKEFNVKEAQDETRGKKGISQGLMQHCSDFAVCEAMTLHRLGHSNQD